MGGLAFVFPGQGAQYSGMGRSLFETSAAAKQVLCLSEKIRPGTLTKCFEGSKEELMITKYTQPCLYSVDLAAASALREQGVIPDRVAGFSLGEIAALTFSGIFGEEEGFRLVCRRGKWMQDAAESSKSSMLAVVKLDHSKVEELCANYAKVYPVNYNCPGQLVVAGEKEELEAFKADVKAAGGKGLPLSVSGGFHSPFMDEAANKLEEYLSSIAMHDPVIPVHANYTAQPYEKPYSKLTSAQVNHPVRWQETIERMRDAGVDTFVEVGPGKTLCGFIAKIMPEAKLFHVEDKESLEETLQGLK